MFGGSLVRMASCGAFHTLVATEEGVVWAFGCGAHGLGLNKKDDTLVPTRVDPQRFDGAQVATIAGGWFHSAAVTEGGALFTWGRGKADSDDAGSQVPQVPVGLGHADLRDRLVPVHQEPMQGVWGGEHLPEEQSPARAWAAQRCMAARRSRVQWRVGGAEVHGGSPSWSLPAARTERL